MTDAQNVRDQQRQLWDRFAGGWERWDRVVLPMLQSTGAEMMRQLSIARDAEHLDVASGTGEPGLSIAEVADQGTVVLTDVSAGMLDVARRAAHARGLANVETLVCSADDLPFPDASFDSLSCRFGVMFVPDVGATLREFARVLRPGGRLSVSVWAAPESNPWATIPLQAVATEVELPTPPPDAPGVFRCAAPGSVSAALEAAGLRDPVESDVNDVLTAASAEEYWEYMTDVAAPLVAALNAVDDAARERVRNLVIDQVREFEVDGGPQFPLRSRCIAATR